MKKLPPWLENRYECLWRQFKDAPFRYRNAIKLIQETSGDSKEQVSVALSELGKAGLLEKETDPEDARKRIYRLKSKSDLMAGTITELSRGDLDTLIWEAANLILNRLDYTAILFLLFYKLISDKWEGEVKNTKAQTLKEGLDGKAAEDKAAKVAYHEFDIPEGCLWESLCKDREGLPGKFSRAMEVLAKRNPEFRDLFEATGFAEFAGNPENSDILIQLVELFSGQRLDRVSPDLLGNAYERVLRFYAPLKAREVNVYTPREITQLLVRMLGPKPGESVYDAAMGFGGMLISSYQHVKNEKGKPQADKLALFGQELEPKFLALARMNLYINDIKDTHLSQGDSLLSPKFKEGDKMQTFDLVLANPPWNLKGYGEGVLRKSEFGQERFGYGFPPDKSADWAWIEHMMASAKPEGGRVGVVMDIGCLFRGGKERVIRTGMIEKDLLDTVILLPENLFYNTRVPGTILVFRHRKPDERRGKVLFIDVSREYEQHPEFRKLIRLGPRQQNGIAEAYNGFRDINGFSRVVPLEEIRKNDYNLIVTRYVSPVEKRGEIDIPKVRKELKQLDAELEKATRILEGHLDELGYK
jgi:type I restriction enzyme M protein